MKWLQYSLLIVGIWLLVIMQTSFLSALGNWGAFLHPVLWCLIYMSFFSKKYVWSFAILGGLILDIISLNFGLNLLALVMVALSLHIIHRYHLALHNLFSWLLSGIIAVIVFIITIFILDKTLGIIWNWVNIIDLNWEHVYMFIITNIIALVILFGLDNLVKYFYNGKRY